MSTPRMQEVMVYECRDLDMSEICAVSCVVCASVNIHCPHVLPDTRERELSFQVAYPANGAQLLIG